MSGRVVHVNDRIEGAFYIGRLNRWKKLAASPLANPYRITEDMDRQAAVNYFHGELLMILHATDLPATTRAKYANALIECRGRPLACWCRHDGAPKTAETLCHGDAILAVLAEYTDDELRAMTR